MIKRSISSLFKKIRRLCLRSPLFCVSGITGTDLNQRVRSIMTLRSKKLNAPQKIVLAAFGLAAIMLPAVFGALRMIPLYGQTLNEATKPLPSFAVATIKPGKKITDGLMLSPGRLLVVGATLPRLIKFAYGIPYGSNNQVSGGPSWINSASFDIEAKAEQPLPPEIENNPNYGQLMLQALLADRFKLKIHHETRQLPVYALTIAKGGSKLTLSKRPPLTPNTSTAFGANFPTQRKDEWQGLRRTGRGQIKAMRETMPSFVQFFLQERPELDGHLLIDETGLKDQYEFTLQWKPIESMREQDAFLTPADSSWPSLSVALEEQLGLKLVPTKGPVDTIVIDSVEMPTEN